MERFERNLHLSLDQVLNLDPALVVVSELEAMRVTASSDEFARLDRASERFAPGAYESLVQEMVGALMRYLYQRNQFLAIPESVIPRIRSNYERFIDEVVALVRRKAAASELTAMLSSAVRVHIANLNWELGELLPQMPKVTCGQENEYGSYPCFEYSPELQLQLIGGENITGRILDVGCGRKAALVETLRRRGIDAYGLDRDVVAGPYVYDCDWFDFEFEAGTWDTVISHMALSNHIVYQMAHGTDRLVQYITLYARILASLRTGGRFVYTPGLPFLEHQLPRTGYTVTSRPVGDSQLNFRTTIVRRVG
jgi:hypothetical protein